MKKLYSLILSALIFGASSIPHQGFSQGRPISEVKPMSRQDINPVICDFREEDMHTSVPFRYSLEELKSARTNNANAANFEVTYFGFSSAEQAAFQYAVDLWAALLTSDVTIRIEVGLSDQLGEQTLASTGVSSVHANFNNVQKVNTWYVPAMAEKIAGEDLNGEGQPDISMAFNIEKMNDFYLGTDMNTPSGQFDMVTIALHEIGHGLGFFTSTFVGEDGTGEYGRNLSNVPLAYTSYLEDGTGQKIVEDFENPSIALGDAFTGDNLFFQGDFLNSKQKVYAPSTFNGGSSISHLNESSFPTGADALMTPSVGFSEAIHDPGIALDMLFDMGWASMNFEFDGIKNQESTANPVTLVATITADGGLAPDGALLYYSFDNFATVQKTVVMTATGNPDEFSGQIDLTGASNIVSYYLEGTDGVGRIFTSPGSAPDFFFQFEIKPDTFAPIIVHQPLDIAFANVGELNIRAFVIDSTAAGDLSLTYQVNGSGQTTVVVPKINEATSFVYIAEHDLPLDISALGPGDLIEYRLTVTDLAVSPNTATIPETGFYQVKLDEILPAVEFYQNDFSVASTDFVGKGFSERLESGFSNDAIHSDHPYKDDITTDRLDLFYVLKRPITVSPAAPIMKFDEVVLLEPGEPGNVFGDDEFWDYVVVEASLDSGVTWNALAPGYDSGNKSEWENQWYSDTTGFNVESNGQTFQVYDSNAAGFEDLYRERIINLLENDFINAGDEILLRFRLYADSWVAGWGWAIDNLSIQIDDESPEITHIPPSYLSLGDTEITFLAKVLDNAVLDSVTFEVKFDGITNIFGIDSEQDIYQLNLTLPAIIAANTLEYRIIAVDSATTPNTTFYPSSGYINVPIAVPGEVKTTYVNDFNAASDDFYGTSFSVGLPAGFSDASMNSAHPYSNSPISSFEMTNLLKHPIRLNEAGAYMSFDEIGLVDPSGDKLAVQVSKDGGQTWVNASEVYSSIRHPEWIGVFNTKDSDGNSIGPGTPGLIKNHFVNLASDPSISGGDEVLVRFSMLVNERIYGWGWLIDNIEIQGPTTAIYQPEVVDLNIYPNPANQGTVMVSGKFDQGSEVLLELVDINGRIARAKAVDLDNGSFNTSVDLTGLRSGIFIVKVISADRVYTRRLIIK